MRMDRKWHAEQLNRLDPQLRAAAVAMLKDKLRLIRNQIVSAMAHDPDGWWTPYHHRWGTAIRNLLRDQGFTDEKLGGNLDDFYIGLVEEAMRE